MVVPKSVYENTVMERATEESYRCKRISERKMGPWVENAFGWFSPKRTKLMGLDFFLWHEDILIDRPVNLEYETTLGTWILNNALAKNSLSARPA